jgi:hypothetical protein
MPAGRPSLLELEPEMVAELELHLRNGNYINVVCDFVGIDSGVFRLWMRRGRNELRRVRAAQAKLADAHRKLENPRLRGDVRRKLAEGGIAALEAEAEVRPAEAMYVDFCTRMKRAQAQAQVGALGLINRAALGQPATEETIQQPDGTIITRRTAEVKPAWQAAAWRLERTNPDLYARRPPQQVQISGAEGAPPVEVNQTIMGGPEVIFVMPHNGRAPIPDGARVEARAPRAEPNPDPAA